ncbi:uncharacterized protein J8A68_001864 [[Candida] subhashii]|uniref:AMP-activated protein kinase glycogen-binding domain-containing protein n=1 Tax=[Candida] subhashii TaxID=561895 RepID=A0A8J5V3H7_9ASCO|nr:uncharacterized protein J8A68_001864 [[Candida] subhashii]KAG7664639.1 hypothetical protein J8A68_001864 [[Candida] subhashii]
MYSYTINWPSVDGSIKSIQITGNFDNWSRSIPAKTDLDHGYSQEIKVADKQNIVFKFIINDNDWITNEQFKIETDESGNSNNIIEADELIEEQPEQEQTKEAAIVEEQPKEAAIVEDQPKEAAIVEEQPEEQPEEEFVEPEVEEEEEPEEEPAAEAIKEAPVVVETPEIEEPVQIDSIKSPKSFATEEDILSDFDDKVAPISALGAAGVTATAAVAAPQHLSQVLTSSSSFAAVSLPPSSSEYENVHPEEEEEQPEQLVEDQESNVPPTTKSSADKNNDEFTLSSNTPATTTTRPVSSIQDVKPALLSKTSESTLQAKVEDKTTSSSGDFKIPGGYPTSPEVGSAASSTTAASPKKEKTAVSKRGNLISRFKSLFR